MKRTPVLLAAGLAGIYLFAGDNVKQTMRDARSRYGNRTVYSLNVENLNWRYDYYANTLNSAAQRNGAPPPGPKYGAKIKTKARRLTLSSIILNLICKYQVGDLTPEQRHDISVAVSELHHQLKALELERMAVTFVRTAVDDNGAHPEVIHEDNSLIEKRGLVIKEIMAREIDAETKYIVTIKSILTQKQWVRCHFYCRSTNIIVRPTSFLCSGRRGLDCNC
jgi:hypothetical protein